MRSYKKHLIAKLLTAEFILVLKLRCNKHKAYIERPTRPSSKTRPHSKDAHTQERTKILAMDLEETEARNDCAGEGQQQFN
jgi:hypothetical protein